MSFSAKNLSYESNVPPFLRRLRGEHGVRDPSRHERQLARPRKPVQEGEKDEQPTYVVENSQDTLSKAEYEALVATNDGDKQNEMNIPSSRDAHHRFEEAELREDEVAREAAPVKQRVAGIGSSSKRRLAKVVGKEEEEKEEGSAPEMRDPKKRDKKTRVKKGKKMKLSFDEEGTEA